MNTREVTHKYRMNQWTQISVNADYRVYLTQMDQLLQLIKTEDISGRSWRRLRMLYHANLVILDEVGFQPIPHQEANLIWLVEL